VKEGIHKREDHSNRKKERLDELGRGNDVKGT
jgi:hypothetical protein